MGENIISDPGFDQGIGTWQSSRGNGKTAHQTQGGHSTPGCLKVECVKPDEQPGVNAYSYDTTSSANPGEVWRSTVWVKHTQTSAQDFNVQVNARYGDDWKPHTRGTQQVKPGQWTRLTVTKRLSAGVDLVRAYPVYGFNTRKVTQGEFYLVDDVELVLVQAAPLSLTATMTAPDTVRFDVDNADTTSVKVDPGDGAAPLTVAITALQGSVTHKVTKAGTHRFTATTGYTHLPLADSLLALDDMTSDLADLSRLATALDGYSATRAAASATYRATVGDVGIEAELAGRMPPTVWVSVDFRRTNISSWTLERQTVDGALTPILAGNSHPPDAMTWDDREGPLDERVRYRISVTYADNTRAVAYTDWITIPSSGLCYVSDSTTGDTVAMNLVSYPQRTSDPRQTVLAVQGRADPVVLSDRHLMPHGDLTMYTLNRSQEDDLYAVLTTSARVLVRHRPYCKYRDVHLAVGAIQRADLNDEPYERGRLFQISAQEVLPLPISLRLPNVFLKDLAAKASTLGGLEPLAGTLFALSRVR